MSEKYTIAAGRMPTQVFPLPPFSPLVLSFLQTLSHMLLHSPLAPEDPTWAALGFWLRSKHLEQIKKDIFRPEARLGRGLVFHITPANMPAMFAYSLVISLLAGNGNIIRISPRIAQKVQPVCTLIDNLLSQKTFRRLQESNVLLIYGKDKELTDTFSNNCDSRIIWGGDASIREIRTSPLPPQATEMVFADRYSIALIDSQTIDRCTDSDLQLWAHRFYNDTYEMDQNACSSPKLIFWLTQDSTVYDRAQRRWWHAVSQAAQYYNLPPIKVSQKYTAAWQFAMTHPEIQSIYQLGNTAYIYTLAFLPADITTLSGLFGQFFQYPISSAADLLPCLNKKIQTLSVIGVAPDKIRKKLIAAGAAGIDRIVPTGQAMDMNVIWDGVNMIHSLSRIIG